MGTAIFFKIKGGWINTEAIRTAQVHPDNPVLLKLLVTGYEQPILLNQADSAYVGAYLESRTWRAVSVPEPQAQAVDSGAQE